MTAIGMKWFKENMLGSHKDRLELKDITISEMAETYNVTMRTLRFYEEKKFLHPKRVGNRRIYRPEDQKRMSIITKGKRMGLALEDIKQFVNLVETIEESNSKDPVRLSNIIQICQVHMRDLDDRQDELNNQIEETKQTLKELKKLSPVSEMV